MRCFFCTRVATPWTPGSLSEQHYCGAVLEPNTAQYTHVSCKQKWYIKEHGVYVFLTYHDTLDGTIRFPQNYYSETECGGQGSATRTRSSERTTHLMGVWDSCMHMPPTRQETLRCVDVETIRHTNAIVRGGIARSFLLANICDDAILDQVYHRHRSSLTL